VETDAQRLLNLGYWRGFMTSYGRAALDVRAELYRDTQAYRYGAETATQLYSQVTALLGVTTPPGVLSPQPTA
jgi:hypothetical protein